MKRSHVSLLFAALLVLGVGVGVVLASYPGDEPGDWEWYDNFGDQEAQNFTGTFSIINVSQRFQDEPYTNDWGMQMGDEDGQVNSSSEIVTWGVTSAEYYHRAAHSYTNNGNWVGFGNDGTVLILNQRPTEWQDCDGGFDSGISAFHKDDWTDIYVQFHTNGTATVAVWDPDTVDTTTDVTLNTSCMDGSAEIRYEPGDESMSVERVGVNPGQTSGAVAPTLGNPSPQGTTTSNPGSFEVNVDDGEFPDDTVEWEIGFEGTVYGSGTLNSADTVSATMPSDALDSGSHSWWANATDSNGLSTNETYTYTNSQDFTAPQLTNPSPQGTTSSNPGSFQVDVSDADFPDDTVDWEIGFEGSVVDSGTLNSDGTISATMPSDALDSGSHSWWANATDADGASTNETFSYTNPQNVTIREERPPHDVINNSSVAIFEDEKDDPFLSNQSVTDGKIELGAVPGGSDFTLVIESPGYNNRTVQLESIFAQGEVFLINNSVQTLQNRFIIQDNTGRFPPEETEIILQHAINQSLYDSGGFAWLDVSGDDLGASEEFVDNLTYEERYRVLVRNDEENETRVLGSHMVELVGTVELTIGTVSIDPAAVDQVGYAVNRTNRSGEPVRVHFDYNDSTDTTNEVWVKMFEYRNESNTLLANTSFNGPFGVLTVSQDVPSGQNDTTWVVKAVAQRDGENVVIREIVGPRESVLGAMPSWLVTVIFMFSVWMVAGIFSQLNGDFGAVVVAGLGGMFWFVGLAPPVLGSGVVILALITSAVLLVNERRDGGL